MFLNLCSPLGYDTGFYRRYLIEPLQLPLNPPVAGLGPDAVIPRLILQALRLLNLPTDIILYGSYIVIFALAAAAFFSLARRLWNIDIAWRATLLFIISPVQYLAYWFFLWKNAWGTLLLLVSFLLIEKHSRWLLPVGLLLAFSHQTTSIIYLLTLTLYLLLRRERLKELLPVLTITALATGTLYLARRGDLGVGFPTAVFLSWKEFLLLSAPLIILALWGIKKFFVVKPPSILIAFTIVSIIFPLLHLPFYERIFIFTDINIIFIAALGWHNLQRKQNLLSLALLFLILIGAGAGLLFQIRQQRPLISPALIQKIKNLEITMPAHATIFTEADLAPWVHGFVNRRIIGPQILGNKYSANQWLEFFNATSTQVKQKFLNEFPQPLYLFLYPEHQPFFTNKLPCLKQKTEFLIESQC